MRYVLDWSIKKCGSFFKYIFSVFKTVAGIFIYSYLHSLHFLIDTYLIILIYTYLSILVFSLKYYMNLIKLIKYGEYGNHGETF